MMIVLCGASSVGKSTLAQKWCSKHPDYYHIEEIARDIMKEKSISRDDLKASLSTVEKSLFLQLQHDIIEEQNIRESKLLSEGKPFISDRGPDPFVYVDIHCSKQALDGFSRSTSFLSCMERYRESGSLCVVLWPLASANDDGIRLVQSTSDQEAYNKKLCELFHQHNVPFIYTGITDLQKRLSMLEDAVKGKFPLAKLEEKKCLSVPFNISRPSSSSSCVYLRQIQVTNDCIQLSYTIFSQGKTNRMVDRYGQDLLVLCFDSKVSPSLVQSILRPGILVNGKLYNFLGCNSSGLRSRTCYMFCGRKKQVEQVRSDCGDFSAIPSVSKRLKRIGMLFSEVKLTGVVITDDDVHIVEDIESPSGDLFTDGCGQIGTGLAKRIMEFSGGDYAKLVEDYLPSVYQIRYQGCKGIVAIDRCIREHQLNIRKSMKKFNSGTKPFPIIGLCDYSKPYSYGHLNKQFIILLSGLGIANEVFLRKQTSHVEYLEEMLVEPEIAIMVCCWKNRPDLAALIAKHSTRDSFKNDDHVRRELLHLKSQLITRIEATPYSQNPKIKLRILIQESRNIFGVCDPAGVLEYSQCFVRVTIRGKPRTITGKVTVGKNPCYLLGDIRVLQAVDNPCLHHLVDCIVFPVKGKRPHPSEIAGSDLDGDQYFVSWDKDLIPPRIAIPYEYPSVDTGIGIRVDENAMIDFFSRQNCVSGMMGKLDGYYMYWASKEGVESDKCQELGKLFSRSVDAAKTGDVVKIPHNLKPREEEFASWRNEIGRKESSPRVWEELEYLALKESEKLKEELVWKLLLDSEEDFAVSEDFLWDLLEYKSASFSEFEIFRIIRKWCLSQNLTENEVTEKMIQFSESVNFGMFTTDEKLSAIDWGIPIGMTTNALTNSKLLTPSMVQYFNFSDSHSYWNSYFSKDSAEFKWQHLLRALLNHKESMVVFQLPDEIIFAIHFLTQLKFGSQEITPGSIVTYFFSPHFRFHLCRVLSSGYSVNINNELMQLYQGNERNTFVWIKSEASAKSTTSCKGEIDFDRVSIDLTRFKKDIIRESGHPRVNKQSYSAIECYVKCFDDETGYFDLYEADQPEGLDPVIIKEQETVVDDFPFEDVPQVIEDDVLQQLKEYSEEVALSCLEASASSCNHSTFLKIIQVMTSHNEEKLTSPTVVKHLLHLLTIMATKYPPFPVPQCVKETLQVILASIQSLIQVPLDCLCVLDRLCRLQCLELITESITSSVEAKDFQDFCDCMKEWSMWTFIPLDLASHFAEHLHSLYSSTLQQTKNGSTLQQLSQMAEDPNFFTSCEQAEKQRYVGKFFHLLVQQLISEIKNGKSNTQGNISRMKVYKHTDPQEPATPSSKLLMGFRSTSGVAPKLFKQGSYVAISSMMHTTGTQGSSDKSIYTTPVAVGQIVQFSRHPTNIVVEVSEPVPTCLERSADLEKGHWSLQILGNVTAFKRANEVLSKILEADSCSSLALVPVLIHPVAQAKSAITSTTEQPDSCRQSVSTAGTGLEVHEDDQFNSASSTAAKNFNISQQKAIDASLRRRLTLIHGPPGTGKTHVACEIVRQVCQRRNDSVEGRNSPVLVAAETNMAVDNLARKLRTIGLRVVRVGGEGQVSPDIRPITLEQQVEMKRIELGKQKRNIRFLDTGLAKMILKAAEVIAVTCTRAGDSVLKSLKFEFVVIDEATQAIEPVTLIPIAHHCRQLTLIGDPQQLSPTLSDESKACGELKVTLFHRLRNFLPSFFLEYQYRMHPALMEFPSSTFYCNKLKSAISRNDRCLINIPHLPSLCKNPLLFIDTVDKEQRIGTSYKNKLEIDVIKNLLDLLLDSNISPTNIVILTPYVGQVHAIKEIFPAHFDVSTIDSFQGRERDIVIFSSVRCNTRDEIGFLCDQYRINVLLTRAKYALIGVGSRETLACSSLIWKNWFKGVEVITGNDIQHSKRTEVKSTSSKKKQNLQTQRRYRHSCTK